MCEESKNYYDLPARTVDITGIECPLTLVHVRAAMAEAQCGDLLRIRMKTGQALRNIPQILEAEGQDVIEITEQGDQTAVVLVQKVRENVIHK